MPNIEVNFKTGIGLAIFLVIVLILSIACIVSWHREVLGIIGVLFVVGIVLLWVKAPSWLWGSALGMSGAIAVIALLVTLIQSCERAPVR